MVIHSARKYSAISYTVHWLTVIVSSRWICPVTASPATPWTICEPIRDPASADATVELLANLGITEAVVMGWSLGGHVAIDMINLLPE